MSLETICYKRNYLIKVIAKIDFLFPNEILLKSLKKSVTKVISKHFPIPEPRKSIAHELKITKEDVEQKRKEGMEWHFFGKDREKEIVITPTSLLVVYLKYSKFEDLFDEFLEISEVFLNEYEEIQANRLGLRYINDIRFSEQSIIDWSQYINNSLLCLLNFEIDKERLIRIFHNIEFNYDDYLLRFQFGIHNSDYPALIKQNSFILDYDAYYNGLIESADIKGQLKKFHDKIQELFEFSITEGLRKKLNE